MSVQLRPDEALEALQAVDAESASRWEAILCAATTAIGAELARHYGCESGQASAEGVAFGGICVPMNPRYPGQPLPEGWEQFDGGAAGEWADECDRLARETPTGKEYALDVTLTAAIRVPAYGYGHAAAMLRAELDSADSNLGAWPNGEPILAEVSLATIERLYEVDGEPVDDEGEEPCAVNRRPKSTCPTGCDHGEGPPPAKVRRDNVEWHAGKQARADGAPLKSNPYLADGERAARWTLGWQEGGAE